MKDILSKTTDRAVLYLSSRILEDKGLLGVSSKSQKSWEPSYRYSTTFLPSLILNCMQSLESSKVDNIRDSLSNLLSHQKSAHWSFNYWLRDSKELSQFPYPDDLDDTFCALVALYRNNPKSITAEGLARIVHLLLATETAVGGPYRTWLASKDSAPAWQNVDIAVNANIAYFLQLIGSPSPPLLTFLEEKIMAGDFSSEYYPSTYPAWYYLARVCPEKCRVELRRTIMLAVPNSSLQIALALSALCQLDTPVEQLKTLAQHLIKQQSPDGSWPAAAFCIDPSRNGKKYFHGSASLTTAFAIEALGSYQKLLTPVTPPNVFPSDQAKKIHSQVVGQAHQDFTTLMPDLRHQAEQMLQKVIKSDIHHQITLLPYLFAESLRKPPPFDQEFYCNLGLANLYGWIAYTIYDDFLDEEGVPVQLSAANVALRLSVDYFECALPSNNSFRSEVRKTFDTIDGANTWEVTNCRSFDKLPSYGRRSKLAERSLGHSLTPLAIMVKTGYRLTNKSTIAVQQALQHYLIARQLDDDAHDWQADFAKGHMSYVVTTILNGMKKRGTTDMQAEFWYHTLPAICKNMQQHIQQAHQKVDSTQLLKPNNVFDNLLDSIERSAQTTLDKQAGATEFLTSYDKITPATPRSK